MKYMSYAHPVAVHIMNDDDTEDTEDGSQVFYSDKGIRYLVRELKNDFCDRDYHLNVEGCS